MLVLLVVAALLAGCATTGAPGASEPGIAVQGIGRFSLPPDTVTVDIGAEARAAQLADATAEVDRRMREVLARVKVAGVDVRTIGYNVEPIADSRPQAGDAGSRIIGYRATNIIQARTHDVAGIGRLVDAAVAAGANVVRSLRFSLDPPDRAETDARPPLVGRTAPLLGEATGSGPFAPKTSRPLVADCFPPLQIPKAPCRSPRETPVRRPCTRSCFQRLETAPANRLDRNP